MIADGLSATKVTGQNRTRFMTEHPLDAGWMEAVRAVEACPCVIFCWSEATTKTDAGPVKMLAERIDAVGHAISVELDKGTRPDSLINCATYPLYGWRAHSGVWQRLLHGKGFITQIAVAAEQKVLGIDPPLPAAYWRMVRGQAWTLLLGIVAVLSFIGLTLGFYRDPGMAKLRETRAAEAFGAAKASEKPCDALRAFGEKFTGSAWSNDANELLGTCTKRQVTMPVADEWQLEIYEESMAAVEREAKEGCGNYAKNGLKLLSVQIGKFVPGQITKVTCVIERREIRTIETIGNQKETIQ